MHHVSKSVLTCILLLAATITAAAADTRHNNTVWTVKPSLKFDALNFIQILSGDPFYVDYYGEAYKRFSPMLTPAEREAAATMKRHLKDERQRMIGPFLSLVFSANEDESLDDMLTSVRNSERLKQDLKRTGWYSDDSWTAYESVRPQLETMLLALKRIGFKKHWTEEVKPAIERRVAEFEREMPAYNVVPEIERVLGHGIASNVITVYVVHYTKPHGIRLTGTQFITATDWPMGIAVGTAIHEMMHPPFEEQDPRMQAVFTELRKDSFVMDKVSNHDPNFGYRDLSAVVDEDSTQALDQVVSEAVKLQGDRNRADPRARWQRSDGGMHVLAVALYQLMKQEHYPQADKDYTAFLARMVREGKLSDGNVRKLYEGFHEQK